MCVCAFELMHTSTASNQVIQYLAYTYVLIVIAHVWTSQEVLVVKNTSTNAGDVRNLGSIPGWGRSAEGEHGNPSQYSCLKNPHGQRNLVGYSS